MFRFTLICCAAVSLFACGASSAGPVTGAADTHCGTNVVTVDPADCTNTSVDAGVKEEEVVRYNAEADDDDCKYHVKFSTSTVAANKDVSVTVTITNKSDGKPATGADPSLESFLTTTHPVPETMPTVTETTPGTYSVSPLRFDASGRWTMKIHLYEACYDIAEASPHGHVSFFFDVP
jgi:YtkA-like